MATYLWTCVTYEKAVNNGKSLVLVVHLCCVLLRSFYLYEPSFQLQLHLEYIHMQYTYIVGKYKIYLYELQKQAEQRAFGELFMPVSQAVQMNFIFNDNVRFQVYPAMSKQSENLSDLDKKDRNKRPSSPFINVVKGVFFVVRVTLVPVSYLSAPSTVHSYRVTGKFIRRLKSLSVQCGKFIRLVRTKQKCIRIAYLYSKCTDCRINIYIYSIS